MNFLVVPNVYIYKPKEGSIKSRKMSRQTRDFDDLS